MDLSHYKSCPHCTGSFSFQKPNKFGFCPFCKTRVLDDTPEKRKTKDDRISDLERSVAEAQDLYVQAKKKIDDLEFDYGGCKAHRDELKAKLNKAEEVLKQYADEGNWYKSNTSTSMPDLEDLWEGNSCDGFIIAQDYFKP